MRGLESLLAHLVRALAERAVGFLSEELRSFCPVEGSDGSDDVLIWHECFPQFLQLYISGLGMICITFQVAPVSELLGLLRASEFQDNSFFFAFEIFIVLKALQKS